MKTESRKIAVDFDGTIVEDQYPQIGKERPFALKTLKALQEKGFILVLWTCRQGAELDDAVEFCRRGGVIFYGVNANYEGEGGEVARKIDADIYIDDRNLGGLPTWGEIYHQLCGQDIPSDFEKSKQTSRKGVLSKIKNTLLGQ